MGVCDSFPALWEDVIIEATLPGAGVGGGDIVTTREGHRYVAPATEVIEHDEDGNLVTDGRWVYEWDAENRLVTMETAPAAIAAGIPRRKLDFAYDGGSRRIAKTVSDWDETANGGMGDWEIVDERRFIYDGWNLIAEVDPTDAPLRTHTWGLDLSQTLQGAGGVGGLLWSTDHNDPQAPATHFATYDGNGNLTALVSSADSTVGARYDYNAFGQTILIDGEDQAIAESNPFRFSTKYEDGETGLYYYGFRYLDTVTGRWLNRDRIEERGGVNLYGFVGNDGVGAWYYLVLMVGLGGGYNFNPNPNPIIPDSPPQKSTLEESAFPSAELKDSVDATLARVKAMYEDSEDVVRVGLCCGIRSMRAAAVSFVKDGQFWEIEELNNPILLSRTLVGSNTTFGPGNLWNVYDLVTFDGGVYWGYSVNYVLWGMMHKLCDLDDHTLISYYARTHGAYSLRAAKVRVSAYKSGQRALAAVRGAYQDRPVDISGALAFTEYGFTGQLPALRKGVLAIFQSQYPHGRFVNIDPREDRAPASSMQWRWSGLGDVEIGEMSRLPK